MSSKVLIMADSITESVATGNIHEGVWALNKQKALIIKNKLIGLKKEAMEIVGDDELYDALDTAIARIDVLRAAKRGGSQGRLQASMETTKESARDGYVKITRDPSDYLHAGVPIFAEIDGEFKSMDKSVSPTDLLPGGKHEKTIFYIKKGSDAQLNKDHPTKESTINASDAKYIELAEKLFIIQSLKSQKDSTEAENKFITDAEAIVLSEAERKIVLEKMLSIAKEPK